MDLNKNSSPLPPMLLMLLMLLLFSSIIPRSVAATTTSRLDIEALMHLKSSIDPSTLHSSSCLGSWDFSHDPCASISTTSFICGIRCDEQEDPITGSDKSQPSHPTFHHRVTSIVLDGYGYRGSLSPYVGNLSALRLLDVSGNSLSGQIPGSLGRLRSLIRLDLSSNRFTGSIPASLSQASSLQYLSLASNSISASIPDSISRLRSLRHLHLNSNLLTGTLPVSMPALTSLLYLDFSSNRLSGQIQSLPDSLLQLSLRDNRFTGPIPGNLVSQLSSLEVLDLSKNLITGALGTAVFLHSSLQQVNVAENRLEWIDSPGVGEMVWLLGSRLVAVDASRNMLRGQLPPFLAALPRLSSLALTGNSLGGVIPLEYALKAVVGGGGPTGVQPLRRLFLDGNMLVGVLPPPFLTWSADAAASFANNCLQSCPVSLFFCGVQRPAFQCS